MSYWESGYYPSNPVGENMFNLNTSIYKNLSITKYKNNIIVIINNGNLEVYNYYYQFHLF